MKGRGVNVAVLIGGLAVFGSFFMPWLGIGPFSVTGWKMHKGLTNAQGFYYAIYLLPFGALAAAVLSVVNAKAAGTVGAVLGGGFLLWGLYEVARILYATTCAGLWIAVVGCAVMGVGGLLSMGARSGEYEF